jgi:hypothetical protein
VGVYLNISGISFSARSQYSKWFGNAGRDIN